MEVIQTSSIRPLQTQTPHALATQEDHGIIL